MSVTQICKKMNNPYGKYIFIHDTHNEKLLNFNY